MTDKQFSKDEVGFSHPFQPTAVRLRDDGTVLIQAGEAAGVVLDSKTGAVTIYGASINFIADDLKIDGMPVDKESLISRAVGKVRMMFGQATTKFPAPKE